MTTTLIPVTFSFFDGVPWPGFADGSTWNGFDNVYVTAETHQAIRDHFDSEYRVSGYEGKELDEVMSCFDLDPDDDGLYSYAYGFATCVDDDQ